MRVANEEGKEQQDPVALGRIRSRARKAREVAACVEATEGGDGLRREKILGGPVS